MEVQQFLIKSAKFSQTNFILCFPVMRDKSKVSFQVNQHFFQFVSLRFVCLHKRPIEDVNRIVVFFSFFTISFINCLRKLLIVRKLAKTFKKGMWEKSRIDSNEHLIIKKSVKLVLLSTTIENYLPFKSLPLHIYSMKIWRIHRKRTFSWRSFHFSFKAHSMILYCFFVCGEKSLKCLRVKWVNGFEESNWKEIVVVWHWAFGV